MEKYGVQQEPHTEGLRNEEHELTLKIMAHYSDPEKTAAKSEIRELQVKLAEVRHKITEIDLNGAGFNGKFQ